MFFLLVVMKVPVIGMIYLLWWASRDQNEADQPADEGGEAGAAAELHGVRGLGREGGENLPGGLRRGKHGFVGAKRLGYFPLAGIGIGSFLIP